MTLGGRNVKIGFEWKETWRSLWLLLAMTVLLLNLSNSYYRNQKNLLGSNDSSSTADVSEGLPSIQDGIPESDSDH
jgi:hypothetical protein